MPEGPEIWMLSKSINAINKKSCQSVGKHLIFNGTHENWSFGLNGRVHIDSEGNLTKINSGWLPGNVEKIDEISELNLGIDFMKMTLSDAKHIVDKWQTKKSALGTLLLKQDEIAGIGVAWGSEILNEASLRPELKANTQDLQHLSKSMIKIRDNVKDKYNEEFEKLNSKKETMDFINGWFKNLYDIRHMNVYKKGNQIKVGSRTWWV